MRRPRSRRSTPTRIEQARILSMRDYVNLTSNMTLMETQNNAFAFVNIRGLAQIRNVDPTVAVVIDGVLSTTSLAFSQDLYDIQQIEVLKGPQGALYGRNAIGRRDQHHDQAADERARGLRPRRLRQRRQHATLGRRERPARRGHVARPHRRRLQGRRRLARQRRDGREGGPVRGPHDRRQAALGPRRDTTLDLRLTYSDTESTGSQFVSNAPNFVTGFPGNAQYPGNGSAPPVPGLPTSITALIGDPNNTSIKHQGNEPGMDDREAVSLSAKFDWEADFGTLTSITSYDELDHVTAAEQFAYYPFVQVAGTPGAGLASGQRRSAGVSRGARRLRHRPEPHLRPEPLPRRVQPGAAHHVPRRPSLALDRRRLLRADRPRRDDRDQQRLRPGLRGAAHGSEHRRHQSHRVLDAAISRAVDTDPRVPGALGAQPEHQPERARVQLRQQPQHGLRACSGSSTTISPTSSSFRPRCVTTATSAS